MKREKKLIKIDGSIIYEAKVEGFKNLCSQWGEILLDPDRIFGAPAILWSMTTSSIHVFDSLKKKNWQSIFHMFNIVLGLQTGNPSYSCLQDCLLTPPVFHWLKGTMGNAASCSLRDSMAKIQEPRATTIVGRENAKISQHSV